MNANPDKYYFEGECRCLFDKDTLDSTPPVLGEASWKDDSFDSIDRYQLGVGPVNTTALSPNVEYTILCGAIVNRYNINEQGVTAVY
jgi:hypothetical protein